MHTLSLTQLMYVMEYSLFLHTSATLFRDKTLWNLRGPEEIHVYEPICSRQFTQNNTWFIYLNIYFSYIFKVLFEAHNYSKSVCIYIFKHSLPICTHFHTRIKTYLAVGTFLHTDSIFRLQLQDSQPHNITKWHNFTRLTIAR
jgi:hypothetical protein